MIYHLWKLVILTIINICAAIVDTVLHPCKAILDDGESLVDIVADDGQLLHLERWLVDCFKVPFLWKRLA